MSVTVRLAKIGKKNSPAYKVVVTNTRTKRNGMFLDVLGHYNPAEITNVFSINKEKLNEWVSKGAFVTDAVAKIAQGNYKFSKYDPKAKTNKEE